MEEQNNMDMRTSVQMYTPADLKQDPHFMRMKDWIITWLFMLIPFANIILPFIWAFGTPSEPKFQSRKTLAQAMLVIWLIIFVISLVISLIVGMSVLDIAKEYAQQMTESMSSLT